LKVVNLIGNSDFKEFSIIPLALPDLFQILKKLPGIHLEYGIKCFFHFDMVNQSPYTFFGNVQWKLAKQLQNSDFYSFFHNAFVTANLFEFYKCFQESVSHIE